MNGVIGAIIGGQDTTELVVDCQCLLDLLGNHIGHTLGFPTVNLLPPAGKLLPPNGVYYAAVRHNGKVYKAISNVGTKPTVSSEKVMGVESYLYDFDQDIYGQEIEVALKRFRRPERRFGSLEELKEQLDRDIADGRNA